MGELKGVYIHYKSEYLKPGGYYYKAAEKYMGPHMGHYLHPGRGYLDNLNRTLIVSYDCSEPAEVAIHAVLTQISDAMKYGTNVQASKLDPRGTNCFGRDYIMISHSTGALIADVALSIANQTKTDEILKVKYGDIGLISERCKGRISIQGAYSGSNLARIACTASSASPALFSIAIRGLAAVQNIDLDSSIGPNIVSWNNTISTAINPYLISNSILVDLTPSITRQRWASYLDKVTVPVFTMVGGHPSAVLGQLKYSIHPGYDDGVLTMDSANAGMNSITITSNISADHKKIFDKGIEHKRAVKYYHDIHNGFAEDGFASASIPNLTPTGMIIPITAINSNPQNHFRNHYSFLMAAKEHFLNATEGWALSNNYFHEYARTGEHIINDEEVLVTNDATLYSGGLINPAILNEMGETKIGRYYELPVIRIKWRNGRLRINLVWLKYHLWERTYHKLQNPNLYDCDYAYKYLFPN